MAECTNRALLTMVVVAVAALTAVPIGSNGQEAAPRTSKHTKLVVVSNNHTSFLSLRCFSFDDTFGVQHLDTWQQFRFYVNVRTVFPSATMFNCSTNMGTFVAFRYDYPCGTVEKTNTCHWRFDESMTYLWDPVMKLWTAIEYNPNYESLNRGGVIKGYFVN